MTPVSPENPTVSIIIPSLDGVRDGCVTKLMESIEAQGYRDYEVCMVTGVFPQGKAINQGVQESKGKILVILDDDSRLSDETVLETLVRALDNPEIGMVGASIVTPPESSPFQQKAALQFPRFNTPVVPEITDSDLACHGCCAFRREVFEEIRGEREDIVRGLDPDLRQRLRQAGYRVVLAPNARIYHPLPNGWSKLLLIFFRNGKGSAYALRFQRESVYDTHESLHAESFQSRTRFGYRVFRYPLRLIKALATGQFMRFGGYCAYALGYVWGWFTNQEIVLEPSGATEHPNES